jgi:CRISPR-associated endonuclease Csn1
MSKILGLDLGTNSIGWAIRNTDLTDNQIEKFGVITFNKGVGIDKSGEYSFAAERTKKRAARRLYLARKYRLWATLDVLINQGYCPLTIEDLNKWRYYNKEEARKNNNGGRLYPVWNTNFENWIKLDFDNDGKPDYKSPYQLRKELAEVRLDFSDEINRYKLGRALYHIAQRRGFKSSRKGTDVAKEQEIERIEENEVTLQKSEQKKTDKLKQLFSDYDPNIPIGVFLANKENEGFRIRNEITQYIVRENYKHEIKYIFEFQGLGTNHHLYQKLVESAKNKNDGFIFYKRPLRSQKGLVGKCTLEPNKYRVPVSHPAFEAFRAWAFLNNIKYKDNEGWKQLPLDLKQDIYKELFFRKSKPYFPFSEIENFLKQRGKNWQYNYSSKTTVTACPVSARLKDIFGDDFLNIKIAKPASPKLKKNYYDIEDIWHVLFHFEDLECVQSFASEKLRLDEEKTKKFIETWNNLPVGYGMLSLNAIKKINIFLEKGFIYTEAVLLAKLPEILGQNLWAENEGLLLNSISNIISENRLQKSILTTVNHLISKHKNLEANGKFGYRNTNYKLDESDIKDIQIAIEEQFGASKWQEMSEKDRNTIFNAVKDCYQAYFSNQGIIRNTEGAERLVVVQSGGKKYYRTESGYYRLPKLIDTLKEFLFDNFDHLNEADLNKIYHPSEISIYPPAKEQNGVLKLGSPKTGAFKNPMAMRTLHVLRKLVNYLIETNQIDADTRVVVEVARELNDSNQRWAIEAWQRQREAENQQFSEIIKQLKSEYPGIAANETSDEDIDKIRLFFEQSQEQFLPEVIHAAENVKGKKKKLQAKDEVLMWGKYRKNIIDKYRLWREQGFQCLYTGRFITLADLFDENKIDFEHTLPRSKSFDNSLANLTVCYADYNRNVKKNQIPTQLLNYDKDYDFGGSIGLCTAIKPRLKAWEEKVERIKQLIDFWKTKAKRAANKDSKDNAIRQRHLWQMELNYWQNKLERFTVKEITTNFKNSQLVDTQIISKYAFHYLKSYFSHVDVQKGSITDAFRKIYGLQSTDDRKDRGKHSHHAKDAAVLTLIPTSSKREAILEKYFACLENKQRFTELPYPSFKREHILSIDNNLLVNNLTKNKALIPAKRKVRKRGKEVFIEKPDGTKVNKWATGDCIRGQLHQETFYGAIRPAKRDGNGKILRDENNKIIQVDKNVYVVRVPFKYKENASAQGFKTLEEIKEQIVDEGLKVQIEKQIIQAGGIKEAFEKGIYQLDKNGKPHGNKIRHIRIWASVTDPLPIKKQTYLSNKEYKQNYWAANDENFAYGLYENSQKERGFKILNLLAVAKLKKISTSLEDMFEKEIELQKPKAKVQLKYILFTGTKVIFYKNNESEIEDLIQDHSTISNRLYVIEGFEKDGRIRLKHHLESRPDNELKKLEPLFGKAIWQGFSEVNFDSPHPKLKLSKGNLNFIVEGYDFKINLDGSVSLIK